VVSNTAEVEIMFHDIVKPSIRVGSRNRFVLPLSIAVHVLVVALALFLPVMAAGALPIPAAALTAFVSGDVVIPPEPPPTVQRVVTATRLVSDARPESAPLEAPSAITPERIVEPVAGPIGIVEGAGSIPGVAEDVLLPPAQPPPSKSDVPIPIGGVIRPPTKIKDVRPVYPPIAQAARIEGVVIIETTIGVTGKVLDTKVLRSIPLLDGAALEAVRQWEFTPTLLNGSPVPVVMTVTVNFALK
jgi:periplasmic protein TonB